MPQPQVDWRIRAEAYKRRVDLLEEELDIIKEQLDIIKEQLSIMRSLKEYDPTISALFGLTKYEGAVLNSLMNNEFCTKQKIMYDVYLGSSDEIPGPKIVDVFVCKIRKRLKNFEVDIKTKWAEGYFITPEDKNKIKELASTLKGNP